MNDEQLAALTDAEKDAEKQHFESMAGYICNQCHEPWRPCTTWGAFRALADARLEVARLTENLASACAQAKEYQMEALTDRERMELEVAEELGHTALVLALTALADARLEGKELKVQVAEVTGQRDGAREKVARLTKDRDSWRSSCGALVHDVERQRAALNQQREDVARLTEERRLMERSVVRAYGEREKAENAVASSVVRSEIAESQWLEYRDAYDEVVKQSLQQREDIARLKEERDMLKTQSLLVEMRVMREDIRRLVEALDDEHIASGCDDSLGSVCATSLLLAEMSDAMPLRLTEGNDGN